jgi:hypothetical protein
VADEEEAGFQVGFGLFIFLGAVSVFAFDGVLREVFDGVFAELWLVVLFCGGFDGVHFLSGGKDIDRDR